VLERFAKVKELKARGDVLLPYMSMSPLPLAFERIMEARIYAGLPFKRPVLDIGCGEGLFARIVFADVIDTGIDPDSRELKRAAELKAYAELIQCYGNSIPKPDGFYETIFSNSVLEHIPDLKPVLREAHRLLAPSGRFYFTVPSPNFDRFTTVNLLLESLGLDSLAKRYRKFFNSFWKHYHYYALEEWIALARECGFEVGDAYTYNRWVILPGLRRILVYPFYIWAEHFLKGSSRANDGGLVFVSLVKKEQ
jgi:SAM-dependent methyltransferase